MVSKDEPKKKKGEVTNKVAEKSTEDGAEEVVEKTAEEPAPEKAQDNSQQKISLKTIVMLLLMFVAEGGMMIVQTIFGTLVKDGNTALFSFVMFAVNALILYVCYLVQALFIRKPAKQIKQMEQAEKAKKAKKIKPLSKILLICGALLGLALTVINILATELTSMVPAALLFSISNAIAIIVTMFVGRIVYKEKIGVKNIIGIVLCAASLTVVGIFM